MVKALPMAAQKKPAVTPLIWHQDIDGREQAGNDGVGCEANRGMRCACGKGECVRAGHTVQGELREGNDREDDQRA
jgi:hypothetical protein